MWRRLSVQLRTLAPKSNQFISDTVLPSSPPPFVYASPASLCFRQFNSETGNASAKMKLDLGITSGSRLLLTSVYNVSKPCLSRHATIVQIPARRFITTGGASVGTVSQDASASLGTPRVKFKRLDKTAQHIMQILDKEAVEEVRVQREIPDIKPGYIIQLKVINWSWCLSGGYQFWNSRKCQRTRDVFQLSKA